LPKADEVTLGVTLFFLSWGAHAVHLYYLSIPLELATIYVLCTLLRHLWPS